MKFSKILSLPLLLCLTNCGVTNIIQNTADQPLKSKLAQLSLVEENRSVIEKDNETYLLDTYIKPFQRPYYIHVRKENNTSIQKDTAVAISKEYIKTRGCTSEIKRPFNSWDYDINTFGSKAWLIYLEC